jgi:hypothetical protein
MESIGPPPLPVRLNIYEAQWLKSASTVGREYSGRVPRVERLLRESGSAESEIGRPEETFAKRRADNDVADFLRPADSQSKCNTLS